jgi:hypothetical protein
MNADTSLCALHGRPRHRDWCTSCNAAYMRDYMRRRRLELPTQPLVERARKRAQSRGLAFAITRDDIVVPLICPVLGIELKIGGKRSANSPSLDRIDPASGYVPGNVRVISDRANRLKGPRSLADLERLAEYGPVDRRSEYRLVADYVAREELLKEARAEASKSRNKTALLGRLVPTLDRIFAEGLSPQAAKLGSPRAP